MNIKQFTVGFSRTINLGNYESCRIEASVVIELNEGDDRNETMAQAQYVLRDMLERTYRQQYLEQKK